jgi:hypothetical protein
MKRRLRRSLPLYAVALVLVAAGAYLCFELGRYQAGYSLFDQRRRTEQLEQLAAERAAANEDLRRQLAILETSVEIDRETYAQVEGNLSQLEAKIQSQEEELAFYRGIVSPQDGVAGLRIQSLEVLPADSERHYLLRIVLVQAIIHSRPVAGVVKLRLEGSRDGQPALLELDDLAADAGADELAYGFRYFQGLERELVLPVGFEPSTMQVEISPSEPRGDRLTQSFKWSAISG